MKMFGVLDLDTGIPGCRFSIGVRNSHDRSMRLAAVVGVRVLVCENMAFSGDLTRFHGDFSHGDFSLDFLCIRV